MSILQSSIKKDWRKVDLTFGLVYPNTFELGISSYSFRLVYSLINSQPNFACESFFLPSIKKYPALEDLSPINSIQSVENGILANEFDVIGFSLQYENDFSNVLWYLEKSKIPLTLEERNEMREQSDVRYPIIVGGGVAATSNPLPLSSYFDVFFIGDAEPNLIPFLEQVRAFKNNELEYEGLLDNSRKIEGIYLPSINNKVKRSVMADFSTVNFTPFQITVKSQTAPKAFESNLLIEVNRGCPFKCKFCISSFHNSPFRNKSFDLIREDIIYGIKNIEFSKINLIGSCASSHPKFYEICQFILNKGYKFSIPSIRIDHINDQIISLLEQAGVKTITIAPETATESLRNFTGKNISNKLIFEVLTAIQASKIKNVKMYFLIGLPNETEIDINNIIAFMKDINQIGFNKRRLRVNINPFVPKLNTPFQNHTLTFLESNLHELIAKFKHLDRELRKIPSVKSKFANPKQSVRNARIQAIFSVGDQEMSKFLLHYYQNGANYRALKKTEQQLNYDINNQFIKVNKGYIPWNI